MVLIGCAGSPGGTNGTGEAGVKEVVATGTEESLLAALNAERRAAGKAGLTASPVLAGLARGESDAAAAAARIPGDTTESLKSRSGFSSVGKLQGVLKDRGPSTGKGFVDYWAKGQGELLLDDWGKVGVGISKAADGRLFAVVILGSESGGGSMLMNPGGSPGGF